MPILPSFSQVLSSSSEVSTPVLNGFIPITEWIVGAILAVTFVVFIIKIVEYLYHAVTGMHNRH